MNAMWQAAMALAASPLIIGLGLCLLGAVWVDWHSRRG